MHWTTFQNLISIINSRQIRLYNLTSSTDENEFKYAAEKLTIPDDIIDHSKNFLYTFSFCDIKEKDNPYHWRKFGKKYSGVIIEFEILNDPKNWKNFMLSQTYYEFPEKLIQLIGDLNGLKEKWRNKGLQTEIDLGRLIAFHKKPEFNPEKEIRLSSYYPFKDYKAICKYCNTEFRFDKKRPRITDYFGLNLWVDNGSQYGRSDNPMFDRQQVLDTDYFSKNPQLKITSISVGTNCGISNQYYSEVKRTMEKIIQLKLGYNVVSWSNLSGQYFFQI